MSKPTNAERYEFVAMMLEIKRRDPQAYEVLKAEAWEMVAKNHAEKPEAQLAAWARDAS